MLTAPKRSRLQHSTPLDRLNWGCMPNLSNILYIRTPLVSILPPIFLPHSFNFRPRWKTRSRNPSPRARHAPSPRTNHGRVNNAFDGCGLFLDLSTNHRGDEELKHTTESSTALHGIEAQLVAVLNDSSSTLSTRCPFLAFSCQLSEIRDFYSEVIMYK